MAIREVIQLGNPILRTPASPIEDPGSPDIEALLRDLQDILQYCRTTTTYGRGIAAPQIGVLQRGVFLNIDHAWPLINPSIVAHSEETMVLWDACLSFLCMFCQVTRYRWIKVRYQDTMGTWHEIQAQGDLSELLQHEIDHLDGILALDCMTDIKTLCTREEFERRYRTESPYAL